MSSKSYYGRKAYQSAIKAGKTRDEAISASVNVKREIDLKYQSAGKPSTTTTPPSKTHYDDGGYNFDSDLNGNGTDWHTADDL